MTRLLGVAALTAVYLLAVGSAELGDLALGAALAVAVVAWLPARALPAPGSPATVLGLLPIALWLVGQVAVATARVALSTLGARAVDPGVVEVRLDGATTASIALAAGAITITPGEVVVDADPDRGTMTVHMLDAGNPAEAREHFRALHDRCRKALGP